MTQQPTQTNLPPGVYQQPAACLPPGGYQQPAACLPPGGYQPPPGGQQISVVVQQPGNTKKGREEKWDAGLYGCLDDITTTCAVLCCGPLYLCYLSTMLKESCCLPILVPTSLMALRMKLRLKNNIEGSIISDCCTTGMCPLCVMCQLKRQNDIIDKKLRNQRYI